MGWDDRLIRSHLKDFYAEQEPPKFQRDALLQSAFTALLLKKHLHAQQERPHLLPEGEGKREWARVLSLVVHAGGFNERR